MASTTFTDNVTTILSSWLNDINTVAYTVVGNGTSVPISVAQLLTNVGLNNVTNTSDANKPVSTAQASAIALKSDLATTTTKTTSTGSSIVSSGTTAQRDISPLAGYLRYNSTTLSFEGYSGGTWGTIGGGATGANGDTVLFLNNTTINNSYTLPTGQNAHMVGPLTIATGKALTIPTGQRLVVL